jgi:hypothetical protein
MTSEGSVGIELHLVAIDKVPRRALEFPDAPLLRKHEMHVQHITPAQLCYDTKSSRMYTARDTNHVL